MSGPKNKARARGLCVLHGSGGRRLLIGFGYVAQGARLRERLEPHLAPLRAETLRSLARNGGRFPVCRTVGMCVLLGIAPLCLLNGLAMFDPDLRSEVLSSPRWRDSCIVWLTVGSALVALGADLISRTLEVSPDGLTLRSLFLNRTIPFDRIASIDVTPLDVFEIHERAKIRGDDGRTITLDSGMPSYRAVLEVVRLRVSTKPCGAPVGDPEFA